MTSWTNKVVVITGGSAGLGLYLARQFHAVGAEVVLVARDHTRLKSARDTFDDPDRVHTIAADITQGDDVEALVAQILQQRARVDALVNCAGMSSRGTVADTSIDSFRDSMELNFFAVVRCTRALLPSLLQSRGHVVNIGSLAAKSASRFLGAYPASKFAVAAYSQQLRLELAEQGVHTLLVCPGPIARDDAGERYADTDVPASAQQPGGGVKLKGIDPEWLAKQIVSACDRRRPELVVPGKARLLFAISQLSPRLGDWLIRKLTS